ncbi:hypothetical protein IFM89_018872 [Coptis chinensis]|uniref:Late embryogenesis abundant protein LEA-2 subgroup domain-containing protein n=1 Tax=Coptis chinensis TaxID=261450 RepID=A0A835HDY9_9MAGN|nr:hypothetical protein IFM89_018872 [Coptis chinensis]
MSQIKEIPPQGASYGPSITPQQPRRKRSKGGCCCCLLGTLFSIIIVIIVAIGIALLVGWLVLRPNKMKFYVVGTDLTRFDLTNNNTLYYNLTVDMAARNPNKKMKIYYDELEGIASYWQQRFAWSTVPNFLQERKNTTNIRLNFQGQQVLVVDDSLRSLFDREKNERVFTIYINLYSKIRFRIETL